MRDTDFTNQTELLQILRENVASHKILQGPKYQLWGNYMQISLFVEGVSLYGA